MKFKTFKNLLIAGLFVFLALKLLLPFEIYAQGAAQLPPNVDVPTSGCNLNWSFSPTKCIVSLTQALLTIIFNQVGNLITFAVSLIQNQLTLNSDLLESGLVREGFRITLSLANLGFVLTLILIAFGTILRLETYGMKTMLRNLIIAAVLINFSLTIAGLFLDFSGVIADFFLSRISQTSSSDFGRNLAHTFQIQNLANIKDPGATAAVLRFGDAVLGALFSLAIATVFAVLIAIIFFGIGIMLLVRYVTLTVLLILMPLAWLFFVSPNLKQYWDKWWSHFLRWVFFLPAVVFFIYLGILTSAQIDTLVTGAEAGSESSQALEPLVIQEGGIGKFLQILTKIAIFAGALLAGNAIGIAGAGASLTFGKRLAQGFTGIKPGALGRAGERVGQMAAKGAARIPLVRRVAGLASPTVRKETTKLEAKRTGKGADQIAKDVLTGKVSREQVLKKAGARWRSAVPYLKRQRAQNIVALAGLEKAGALRRPGMTTAQYQTQRGELLIQIQELESKGTPAEDLGILGLKSQLETLAKQFRAQPAGAGEPIELAAAQRGLGVKIPGVERRFLSVRERLAKAKKVAEGEQREKVRGMVEAMAKELGIVPPEGTVGQAPPAGGGKTT